MSDLADHGRCNLQRAGERSIILQLHSFTQGIEQEIGVVGRLGREFVSLLLVGLMSSCGAMMFLAGDVVGASMNSPACVNDMTPLAGNKFR